MDTRPNIVLVHGAWADGSCWSSVIARLQAGGYHVTAPQFPMTALADDVARLRQVLDLQDGPTIVAAHSYDGQIMTALGAGAPNVAGLVYIAAFGLDEGESLGALLSQGPTPAAPAHLITDKQGFGWLPEDDYVHHFAADVDPIRAKVMHAVQQALASSTFTDVMGVPAWKSLPSWYLVATQDQAIPPDAERLFAGRMGATTIEVPSSHVAMVSHPAEVRLTNVAADAAGDPTPGQPDLGASDRGARRRLGPGRPRQHQRGTGTGSAGPDSRNSRWPDHRPMIEPSAGRSCQKVLLATGGGNRGRPGCGRSGTLQELR